MKALVRAILFTRHTQDGGTVTRPVAVFPNVKVASAFKGKLSLAHASGIPDRVRELDPTAPLTKDGKLHPKTLFALVEVPYAPGEKPVETKDDTFDL